jgi:diguanylate cyclase
VLHELKRMGVFLAVDDFGTGWSSLSRLSSFPWDALKIDRSFVARLDDDAQANHVVGAMVAMGHALGMLCIAEGVETPAQARHLRRAGCDIAQGYLYAVPSVAADVVAHLSAPGGDRPVKEPAAASS